MGEVTPGTVLGGCRIDGIVGRGGMGVVYRARQLDLDRDVAVKVIAPELVEDPKSRKRFLTEARAAGAVEHPNVLPVHGAGVDDGRAYLVMRYVAGDDLRTLVRREGPQPPERAADIARQLGDALDAIHAAGYVHRDVKPQNVLIDDRGHVYLSDFGLAKQALASAGPTTSEQWVGTLDYVAPEQIRGERVDARADVYALGGVLYFTLTARVPFERSTDHAKLWAHLVDEPPRPSAAQPALPSALDAVVARAMAKDPAHRYPSAGDLGRAARAAAIGEEETVPERTVAIGAAAPGADATTVRSPRVLTRSRRRLRLLLAAAGAVAAAAAGAVLWLGRDDESPAGHAVVSQPTATPAASERPRVGLTTRDVGRRPRAVAVAGGAVWVLSIYESRLARIDPETGRRAGRQPHVGRGAADIAGDGDMVWVAKRATGKVLGLDARSGEVVRQILTSLPPARVAAGRSGLWVVLRAADDGPAVLQRYDRDGAGPPREKVYDAGIEAIALGSGAAWVALSDEERIVRIGTDWSERSAWPQATATTLAFGAGRLWASLPDDQAVARIDPGALSVRRGDVGPEPAGLAVAGGRVFVAGNTTDQVTMLNPRSVKLRGKLEVRGNPYAVTSGAGHVWVTSLGTDTLTRLDY
jgi:Protein kinase domain